HAVLAVAYMGLAVILMRQGKNEQALSYFNRSCDLSKSLKTDETPTTFQDIAHSLLLLSQGHYRRKEYDEAEVLLRHSMLIEARELWPDHPLVADSLSMLADLYRAQRQFREAEFLYTKALKIRQNTLGADHPIVATSLFSLADLYASQQRDEEALELLTLSLQIVENDPRKNEAQFAQSKTLLDELTQKARSR
ncbi:MAG TPA: tetratricopeptide repeat protein, partial [Candidatus Melainabacteria bacterium]|nr:tetratricopeptide repeat protein [Candidatus Melainabacteria bacterium]HIN66972.1 tetratricopeptide repeat protein [Candidatus Obscuribacterales bacterium]